MPQPQKIKTGKQFRTFRLDRQKVNEESRTVELSFSSETPVQRWFGEEVLDHRKKSIRLERLKSAAPLLLDHNSRSQVGVIEKVSIDAATRKGTAVVRLGKGALAEEVFQDVLDGIRQNVSVGYLVHRMVMDKEEEGHKTYRATDWEPFEISLVAVPADTSVGVGRSEEVHGDHETFIELEEREMPLPGENTPAAPAQPAAPGQRTPEIDLNEVRTIERNRLTALRTIGGQFKDLPGIDELVRQHEDNGGGADALAMAINEKMGQRTQATDVPEPVGDLGMNQREKVEYSFLRAARLAAGMEEGGFEAEVSQQIGKQLGRDASGIFVPTALDVRAPAVAGADGDGGYTVDTKLMPIIELLKNRMMVRQLGAQVLSGLEGNLSFPKQLKSVGLTWQGENPGADAGDMDMTDYFGQLNMTPKSATATIPYSKQFLAQSSLSVEQFFRNDLSSAGALGLDMASINGSGGSDPRGILNTAGIGLVVGDTNGIAPAWSHIVKMETEVAVDNADIGNLAYLTNAKVRGKLKETERFAGTGKTVWSDGNEKGFGALNGYRAAVSNQVPSDLTKGTADSICSALIYGNWADLLIGEWGVLEIIADPYRLKKQGLVELTLQMLADVTVRRAQSFSAMVDALTN